MRKLFWLLLVCVFVDAADIYVTLGANTAQMASKSGKGVSVGWGTQSVFSEKWYLDVGFLFGYTYIDRDNQYRYGCDFKSGYKLKHLQIFALLTGMMQNYDIYDSAGFGYGGGIEYRFARSKVGVGSSLRHYSMTSEINEYNFDLLQVYLKWYLPRR